MRVRPDGKIQFHNKRGLILGIKRANLLAALPKALPLKELLTFGDRSSAVCDLPAWIALVFHFNLEILHNKSPVNLNALFSVLADLF